MYMYMYLYTSILFILLILKNDFHKLCNMQRLPFQEAIHVTKYTVYLCSFDFLLPTISISLPISISISIRVFRHQLVLREMFHLERRGGRKRWREGEGERDGEKGREKERDVQK